MKYGEIMQSVPMKTRHPNEQSLANTPSSTRLRPCKNPGELRLPDRRAVWTKLLGLFSIAALAGNLSGCSAGYRGGRLAQSEAVAVQEVQLTSCGGRLAHLQAVGGLAFSPRGDVLYSGAQDASLNSWAPADARFLQSHGTTYVGYVSGIFGLALSGDGKWLATASDPIKLLSMPGGVLVKAFSDRAMEKRDIGCAVEVGFSPNGKTLYSTCAGPEVGQWSVPDGSLLGSIKAQERFSGITMEQSRNGRFLATGGYRGTVKLWSLPDNRLVLSLTTAVEYLKALALSPDMKLLAVGGSDGQDGRIQLWELPQGRAVAAARSHGASVSAVRFVDGSTLLSGGEDAMVRTWSVPDLSLRKELRGHRGGITCLAVAPNGAQIASGDEFGAIRIWSWSDPRNSRCLVDPAIEAADFGMSEGPSRVLPLNGIEAAGSLETGRTEHTATVLQDGRVIVVGGFRKPRCLAAAEIFDPRSRVFKTTGDLRKGRFRHTATLLADGKVLILGGDFSTYDGWMGAELYDPSTGRFAPCGPPDSQPKNHSATLLLSGKVLVVGRFGKDQTAKLYEPVSGTYSETGTLRWKREAHTATRLSDGTVLVVGGKEWHSNAGESQSGSFFGLTNAEVYDESSGAFSAVGGMAVGRYGHSATLLADGQVLIAGGFTGESATASAELYDPVSRSFRRTGDLVSGRVRHTATLLADNSVLVVGGDRAELDKPSYLTSYVRGADRYLPTRGVFERATELLGERIGHTASCLQGGELLIVGGEREAPAFGHTQIYPTEARLFNPWATRR